MFLMGQMVRQGRRVPRDRVEDMVHRGILVNQAIQGRKVTRVTLEPLGLTALLALLALLDLRARKGKLATKALMVMTGRVDPRDPVVHLARRVKREKGENEVKTERMADQDQMDQRDPKDAVGIRDQPVRSDQRDLVAAVARLELGELMDPRDQRVHRENKVYQAQMATQASQDALVVRDQQVRKGTRGQMVAPARTGGVEPLDSEVLRATRDRMDHVDRSVYLDSEARTASMVDQEIQEHQDQLDAAVLRVLRVRVDPRDARLCATVTHLINLALAVHWEHRKRTNM